MIGKRIVKVRRMTNKEMKREGWEGCVHRPVVLVLDDGTLLYPSCDDEGNGPGAIFGFNTEGQAISIIADGE
jgi:hypothetical protein